ncbi:MAG: TetR/AcrR family transcriptional regulator [Myxococcota bacterium]|nr:TetR/AcrR family transcriptional regulator [Myxococcota bacterium]
MKIQKEKPAKHAQKKEDILDAASRIIVDKGIKHTSLSDIAKELGISKGTLYYYYASKNDIVFDIAERHMQRITERLFSIIKASESQASLEKIFGAVIENILDAKTRSSLHIYLIREALTGNSALKERFVHTYRQWFALTEEIFRKVLKDQGDYSTLAPIIVAVLDGLVIQTMFDVQENQIENTVSSLLKIVV